MPTVTLIAIELAAICLGYGLVALAAGVGILYMLLFLGRIIKWSIYLLVKSLRPQS